MALPIKLRGVVTAVMAHLLENLIRISIALQAHG
jgi:hypothetical protein